MISVFAAFMLDARRRVKMFGRRPRRSPCFVDATVVRMVLVPATMALLGERQLVAARRGSTACCPTSTSRDRDVLTPALDLGRHASRPRSHRRGVRTGVSKA